MKKEEWFVPKYYPEFSCKADKCRNSCCSSWRIPVSRKEYNRLITMECSDDLNHRVQNAFIIPETVSDECFRYVSFNWLGQCPIQDKGLCYLHREKGESYLPKICRLYPRSLKKINDVRIASCSSSCERIVEMLYEEDALLMRSVQMDEEVQITIQANEDEIRQILLFQDLIKDKTTPLAQSIADICVIINHEEFDKDMNSDEDPLDAALKLLQRFSSSNSVLNQIAQEISERYEKNRDLYEKDRTLFENRYTDWMGFFERVINNSMIYECFPFVDPRADKTGVYKGLCVCYGLLRIICIGHCASHDRKEDLIDAVSALFHLIDHTAFYYNMPLIVDNAAIFLKL